eukprot:scaffold33505_cov101-Skeletonema_dohrnii-CCMP3373.AAC.8
MVAAGHDTTAKGSRGKSLIRFFGAAVNMSEVDDNAVVYKSVCASCGIAEVDDIKLKECADCDLVRYCSDECQENHTSQHKEACKKRAAELRDEILFNQPESSHLGDCPICCLPLSLDPEKATMTSCCSKLICMGCFHANKIREYEGRLGYKCVFCRKPTVKTDEERDKNMMKRIEANDPVAMNHKGVQQYNKGDYSSAFEYCSKAAELGDAEAHNQLSIMYHYGEGVEKDIEMVMYHLEQAAIGGHPHARYNLGCVEKESGNIERAVKHWIISANLGDDGSISALMDNFKEGCVSKDDLAAALRAHQAAVNETKSPQRDAAEA